MKRKLRPVEERFNDGYDCHMKTCNPNQGSHYLISRRQFIGTAGALAASAGMLSLSEFESQAAERARWVVACRDLHLKAAGKPDSWSCAKALGTEGVEVDVELDLSCPNLTGSSGKYSLATPEGIQALKSDAQKNDCRITAFVMNNRLDERMDQELEWARKLVKAATQLGVKAIRIDVWPHKLSEPEFLPFATDACKRLCEITVGTEVRYGVENHGHVTNKPEFLDKLFTGVNSPHLGLTLDTANFYWYGHPLSELYGIYEKFAPRVVHTHCKNIKFPEDQRNVRRPIGWEYEKYNCPIYEGDIDFKRLLAILRRAEYRGDLCIEDESLGKYPAAERAGVLQKELATLKQLR